MTNDQLRRYRRELVAAAQRARGDDRVSSATRARLRSLAISSAILRGMRSGSDYPAARAAALADFRAARTAGELA